MFALALIPSFAPGAPSNLTATPAAEALACSAAALLPEPAATGPSPSRRSSFTWSGGGGDGLWQNPDNWTAMGCFDCYPQYSSDDVTISTLTGAAVDLITVTIDDLTLEGDVDFGASTSVTVTMDSLTLVGPGEITFESGITFVTQ